MNLLPRTASVVMLLVAIILVGTSRVGGQVTQLFTIPQSSFSNTAIVGSVMHHDSVVLYYNGANGGSGLYRSNGTKEGTYLLQESDDPIRYLGEIGGKKYFVLIDDFFVADEIYEVNESATEATLLVNLITGFGQGLFHGGGTAKSRATKYNEKLYFFAAPPPHDGAVLVETDGTPEGTQALLKVPYVESFSWGTFHTYPVFIYNDQFYSMRNNNPFLDFIKLDLVNESWNLIAQFDLEDSYILDYIQQDGKIYQLLEYDFSDAALIVFDLETEEVINYDVEPGSSKGGGFDINIFSHDRDLFFRSSHGILFPIVVANRWALFHITSDGNIQDTGFPRIGSKSIFDFKVPRGFFEKNDTVYFLGYSQNETHDYPALFSWTPQSGVSELMPFDTVAYKPHAYTIMSDGDCLLLPAALEYNGAKYGHELWKYCPNEDTWDIILTDSIFKNLPNGHQPSDMVRLINDEGKEYFVYIAQKSNGERIYALHDSKVSIFDLSGNAEDYLIYPNPVDDALYIQRTDDAFSDAWVGYRIVNATGQLVKEGQVGTNNGQVDTHQLVSGFYYIQLYNEIGIMTHPFVKK